MKNEQAPNTVEWVMSIIITMCILLIALAGVFIDVWEYSAKYYGLSKISYISKYHFILPGIMIFYYVYFYLRLFIQGKLTGKINLTWDLVLVSLALLGVQLVVLNNMSIKIG